MELSVKKQLEKQPNTWISKALTTLFVVLVIVWASKGINFSGIKENGVDMVVVQKWLGHTSISMTIDTYTHIEKDYKQEFANNLTYNFIP